MAEILAPYEESVELYYIICIPLLRKGFAEPSDLRTLNWEVTQSKTVSSGRNRT